jgi:hypothetical protein
VDVLGTVGNAAAVGAFVGASLALLLDREADAPAWAIRGSVYGGLGGVIVVIWSR